ncbi:MAG: DUF4381 domain-containing protein [Thiohalocapsa sp.]
MFPETDELRDIHALMGNPWWPPAPGWWLLLGAVALLALALWRFDLVWRLSVPIPMITLGSWRLDASRKLRRLRRNAETASVRESASELSELLRRIAMARHGRAACAGLHGTDWLGWLADNDPKGFDWRSRGRLLLDLPYAPPSNDDADRRALLELIDAVIDWVVAGDPKSVTMASKSDSTSDSKSQPVMQTARSASWLAKPFSLLSWRALVTRVGRRTGNLANTADRANG